MCAEFPNINVSIITTYDIFQLNHKYRKIYDKLTASYRIKSIHFVTTNQRPIRKSQQSLRKSFNGSQFCVCSKLYRMTMQFGWDKFSYVSYVCRPTMGNQCIGQTLFVHEQHIRWFTHIYQIVIQFSLDNIRKREFASANNLLNYRYNWIVKLFRHY